MNAPSRDGPPQAVEYRLTESLQPSALSRFLGFAAMVPFAAGAVCGWLAAGAWRVGIMDATILWGCAILTFLAGVRRGVSFRTPGGATVAQVATTLWLFLMGMAALWAFVLGGAERAADATLAALTLLLAGYSSLAVLDPLAARSGEAPLFFARLRPVQMVIPIASLAALLALRAVQ